ncbi:FAD-binding protein [Variovorax sp. PBS-H4]|uniref:FAD-dependent oxidoreductase n=1 Tax=Variovorax sp. PBS-H4 TaxID=434008 RepID=UPI0013A535AB|nr:FAD-binding oxidoreductase [Variovorax sp. PBS-H4]
MKQVLDDVHSQLNPTPVAHLCRPRTLSELQAAVRRAAIAGQRISVSGGRHAMGGQQFAVDSLHIDTRGLDRVLKTDPSAGLLQIEAGAQWPRIVEATHAMDAAGQGRWGIRQKQTGVDDVTLGGSIAANAHGRGLAMQPLGNDIEDLTLVDARGDVVFCSRTHNAELFSLVIGGYGLFGIVYAATLRLCPRLLVRRVVDVLDLDDAVNAVFRRADEGCAYGDFQFAIDSQDHHFLRRGVLACYKPAELDGTRGHAAADLAPDAWLQLLELAHHDKQAAFAQYARHYLDTHGAVYGSDTMQLSTYIPSYADFLASRQPAKKAFVKETLVIGEHYVPRHRLLAFMQQARDILRVFGTEVIYGTIRSILRDTTSYLPWAKEDFACIIFNLRTPHDDTGRARTADTFRALIDASAALGGSFYLTYHRHASAAQVRRCYPQFGAWLAKKLEHDPHELFVSTWYMHYRGAFARALPDVPACEGAPA